MLSLVNAVKGLARDLRSQKLRTFLTVLGIVWGTVAVSLLLAFGQGLHRQLVKSIAGLGDRIVIVFPSRTSIPYQGLGKGRRIVVYEEDIQAIAKEADGLSAISSEYTD